MIGSIAAQLMLYHFRPWLDHTNIVEVNFSAILCSDDYSSVQIMEHVLKANLINGKCYKPAYKLLLKAGQYRSVSYVLNWNSNVYKATFKLCVLLADLFNASSGAVLSISCSRSTLAKLI